MQKKHETVRKEDYNGKKNKKRRAVKSDKEKVKQGLEDPTRNCG
jgi:hypothetical protein